MDDIQKISAETQTIINYIHKIINDITNSKVKAEIKEDDWNDGECYYDIYYTWYPPTKIGNIHLPEQEEKWINIQTHKGNCYLWIKEQYEYIELNLNDHKSITNTINSLIKKEETTTKKEPDAFKRTLGLRKRSDLRPWHKTWNI